MWWFWYARAMLAHAAWVVQNVWVVPWCITTVFTGVANVAAVPLRGLAPHHALVIIVGHAIE